MHEFTFYGDLLGIASAYRLGKEVANDKLNTFYNIIFQRLAPLCGKPDRLRVQMFSDSVVIWGSDGKEALEQLQGVYLALLDRNLMLRGAIVTGRLMKEPRVEVEGFSKFLPTNDVLARAVGLEKTVKGARLLIEPQLAALLLSKQPEWLTAEGYTDSPHVEVPVDDILRRICPTPSGDSHELLFFWDSNPQREPKALVQKLKERAEFHDQFIAEHLRETVKLVRRSNIRRRQLSVERPGRLVK